MRRAALGGLLLVAAVTGAARAQDPATSLEPLAHVDIIRGVPLRALLADTTDPVLRKVALWLDLRDGAPGVGFEDIRRFLADNPDWPSRTQLKRRAEDLLVADPTADAAVLDWFQRAPPQSRDGQQRWAEALRAAGRGAEADTVLRAAWVDGTFTPTDEKRFLERYGRAIGPGDHAARLDRLLWRGLAGEAQRQLQRAPAEARRIAEARIKLQTNARDAETFTRGLSPTDPGLILDLIRWNRRRNNAAEVERLLLLAPTATSRPELWWQERESAARRALDDGRADAAYRLAADHHLANGVELSEAEFLAGWIALRERKDAAAAATHFQRLIAAVRYPVSIARGQYWLGRAERARGDETRAAMAFAAAARYPTTFYGQLAAAALGGHAVDLPRDPAPSVTDTGIFAAGELVQVTRKLALIGAADRVDPFVSRLADQATTGEAAVLVARLAKSVSRPDLAVMVGRRVQAAGVVLVETSFPTLPVDPANGVEPALVLAVIRQESGFAIDAMSPVGARGLMQLMPGTAKSVATKLGLPYQRDRLTDDASYNITLGQAYLGGLIEDFGGSYILAVMSYNAGPGRAFEWMGRHGDPRAEGVDPIDWIERIPFSETRNYVQRVLEGLSVYRLRSGVGAPAAGSTMGNRWCVLACPEERTSTP